MCWSWVRGKVNESPVVGRANLRTCFADCPAGAGGQGARAANGGRTRRLKGNRFTSGWRPEGGSPARASTQTEWAGDEKPFRLFHHMKLWGSQSRRFLQAVYAPDGTAHLTFLARGGKLINTPRRKAASKGECRRKNPQAGGSARPSLPWIWRFGRGREFAICGRRERIFARDRSGAGPICRSANQQVEARPLLPFLARCWQTLADGLGAGSRPCSAARERQRPPPDMRILLFYCDPPVAGAPS